MTRIVGNIKQEGESCGSSWGTRCGGCADGLYCFTPINDMCGVCSKKKGQYKTEHDICKKIIHMESTKFLFKAGKAIINYIFNSL